MLLFLTGSQSDEAKLSLMGGFTALVRLCDACASWVVSLMRFRGTMWLIGGFTALGRYLPTSILKVSSVPHGWFHWFVHGASWCPWEVSLHWSVHAAPCASWMVVHWYIFATHLPYGWFHLFVQAAPCDIIHSWSCEILYSSPLF